MDDRRGPSVTRAVSAGGPLATASALHGAGRFAEAEQGYNAVLKRDRNNYGALHGLGMLRLHQGRLDDAVRLLRKALNRNPNAVETLAALGDVLIALKRPEEGLARHERALALSPGFVNSEISLAGAYFTLGRLEDAVAQGERAVALAPGNVIALNIVGSALSALNRFSDALARFEAALALDATCVEAHINRGSALTGLNRHDEAIACFERALALRPESQLARSKMLFVMNYIADAPRERVAAAHREWAAIHVPRGTAPLPASSRAPDPDRRLRVGYVSADFRTHPVSRFVMPLLRAHDRHAVEVICYSDVQREDAETQRLKALADRWVSVTGLDTRAVCERIRGDGIDILVDLAGHTAGDRLAVFARKPAPVAVSWLGYPNTTGLDTIDARFTDAVADPPDESEDRFYSERLVRLPRCFLCYERPQEEVPPGQLPAARNGFVTFGSFNYLGKVTPRVVAAWARALYAVPGARMLVKAQSLGDPAVLAQVHALFAQEGIGPERLAVRAWTATHAEHLAVYGEVDIALDTFPYNGTTTTCEALWMGVPVVALRGDRHAARVGASLLTATGLTELIAEDVADYAALAAELAADIDRLAALRSELRQRLSASPLCDAAGFARAVERAYRALWQARCAQI